MNPLYPDEFLSVEVCWSRPKSYQRLVEEGCHHDETAKLYMITARYSDATPKVLYIGKTYKQWVSTRLAQQDHKNRYAAFVKNYPHHRFYVSHGKITVNHGKLTAARVDDVERLLIYANDSKDVQNIKNIYEHGVRKAYRIANLGYRCGLPKEVYLGVFVKTR